MAEVAPETNRVHSSRSSITEDSRLLESGTSPLMRDLAKESWRLHRITSEAFAGLDLLSDLGPAVSIFGSARTPEGHPAYHAARDIGRRFAEEGVAVITGGGPGIMEAANRGALEAGGESIGLEIELPFEASGNPYTTRSHKFRYFFLRKLMFVKYAQAFVVLEGGFGTLDEAFESLTLIQTGKVRDFPVILYGKSYWQGLIEWLRGTVLAGGNINAEDVSNLIVTDSIDEVIAAALPALKHAL